ncbi:unnamed protein product [Lota lota]
MPFSRLGFDSHIAQALRSGLQEARGSGSLAGILSALCVALVGSVSGYFAYQKKKLCFKNREVLRPLCGPSVAPLRPLCGPSSAPLWPLCGPSAAPLRPLCGPSVAPLRPLCGPSAAPLRPLCLTRRA